MVGQAGGTRQGCGTEDKPTVSGPSQCASRGRSQDAAEAVKGMAVLMKRMDPTVVQKLVRARQVAAEVYKAFPEGDQRFASIDTDSDDDEEPNITETPDDIDGEQTTDDQMEECRGLLDMRMDPGPVACLKRAKEEYQFDIVNEMDKAELSFFERIRLVNMLRKVIDDGTDADDAIKFVRNALRTKEASILNDERLLEPFVEGDLLLTVLESDKGDLSDQDESIDEMSEAIRKSLIASNIL